MTANVVITTAEKKNVIAVPQGLIIEKGDKKYVKIQQNEQVIEREITIGLISSLGNAEVLTGLAEGDVLVLSEAQ
jgi:multidrug efflux pump subunit AcrA (membrane-fusion protein)